MRKRWSLCNITTNCLLNHAFPCVWSSSHVSHRRFGNRYYRHIEKWGLNGSNSLALLVLLKGLLSCITIIPMFPFTWRLSIGSWMSMVISYPVWVMRVTANLVPDKRTADLHPAVLFSFFILFFSYCFASWAAWQISINSLAFKLAFPTKAPSILGIWKNSAALFPFTEPP